MTSKTSKARKPAAPKMAAPKRKRPAMRRPVPMPPPPAPTLDELIRAASLAGAIVTIGMEPKEHRFTPGPIRPQMSHETGPLSDPARIPPGIVAGYDFTKPTAQADAMFTGRPFQERLGTEPPLWDFDPKAGRSSMAPFGITAGQGLGTDPNPTRLGLAMQQVDESLDRLIETIIALAATLNPVLAEDITESAAPYPILAECPAMHVALEHRARVDLCVGMLSDIIQRLRV